MPMSPRLLRPIASGLNPRQIAGLGAWFDASDLSTLSQTSDGATPVTADNDPVAYFKCKITGTPLTQAIDANRPLWKAASSIGSKPGLEFDGSNDGMFATSGGLMDVARNVAGLTSFVVFRADTVTTRAWWTIGIGAATNFFRGRLQAACFATGNFTAGNRRLDADTVQTIATAISSGTSYISRQTHDHANTSLQVHLNGTLGNSSSSFQTAGNTSDTASAYVMLGNQFTNDAFTALATPFDGVICEWLIYRRALSAAEAAKVEGYLAWKYGLQGQLPYNHPYARSFPGFGSQTLPTDPDAQTYLAAVAAADGTGVEVGVANAVNDFIIGCKADGIWDAIKASCILMGARTLAGALTPLVGPAPTNSNFVSGDYDRKTGLAGNASTKSLSTNRNVNADPTNNAHMAVFVHTADLNTNRAYFRASNNLFVNSSATDAISGINAGNFPSHAVPANVSFFGLSRAAAGTYTRRLNGSSSGVSETSSASSATPMTLFMRNTASQYSAARMTYYSQGESLDLALLDSRASSLYTAIGAAIP